jgi:CRP-like cAMP-binding protein
MPPTKQIVPVVHSTGAGAVGGVLKKGVAGAVRKASAVGGALVHSTTESFVYPSMQTQNYQSQQALATHANNDDQTYGGAMGSWKHEATFAFVDLSEDEAACKLQAVFRGYLARQKIFRQRPTLSKLFCTMVDAKIPVIMPTSSFRLIWDGFAMFFIVYQFFIVPYYIAWEIEEPYSFAWDSLVDWFFLVDIFLNFRTGVVTGAAADEMNMVSTNGYLIAKYYLKTWFLLDVLATVPGMVDFFTEVTRSGGGASNGRSNVLRILRFFKIFKLVRVIKSSENITAVFEGVEDNFNFSEKYKRVLGMLVRVIFLTHLIACAWFGISKVSHNRARQGWYSGELGELTQVGDDYVFTRHDENDPTRKFYEEDHWEQYIWSIYWAMTTISTVGYGDISPSTIEECVYTILAMCVGVSFFGYLLGSISEIVATDSSAVRMQERMHMLSGYLNEKKVPPQLKRKVRTYFRYMLMHKSMFDEQGILEKLSLKLRLELTSWINKDMIARVPLLQNLDAACVNMIVENLNPDNFDQGELILAEGDAAREMYFICNGAVELRIQIANTGVAKDDFKKVRRLMTGDHFGELPLLPSYQGSDSIFWENKLKKERDECKRRRSLVGGRASGRSSTPLSPDAGVPEMAARRLASASAHTVCDVYALRKETLDRVLSEFPEVLKKLEGEARYRKQAIMKVRKYWNKVKAAEAAAKAIAFGSNLNSDDDADGADGARRASCAVLPSTLKEDKHAAPIVKRGRGIDFGGLGGKKSTFDGSRGVCGPKGSLSDTAIALDERMSTVETDVKDIKLMLMGIAKKLGAQTVLPPHGAPRYISKSYAPLSSAYQAAATPAKDIKYSAASPLPSLPPTLDILTERPSFDVLEL